MHRAKLSICITLALVAPAAADEPTSVLQMAESWHIDHQTHHVQGLCVSEDMFWVSSVDRRERAGWVFRVDRQTLKVAARRRLAFGPQYHPGGMQKVGGDLWVPVAEYRPRSSTTLVQLDAQTLETKRSLALDDHIGALAADGDATLYAVNWDSRQFYVLDERGTVVRRVDNPTSVAYQDIEWHDGRLMGTGQATLGERRSGVVDVIDPATWRLVRRYELQGRLRSGKGHFGREGFSRWREDFYLLPEDGPNSTVYRFGVASVPNP